MNLYECASKAPSGHNLQPWTFKLVGDMFHIKPDFGRSLPVVDSDNRELYISLGCAAENVAIAAEKFGYSAKILSAGEDGIDMRLRQAGDQPENPLFDQIAKRQTNRKIYNGNTIPQDTIEALSAIRLESGIRLHAAKVGSSFSDSLVEYIVRGNLVQMSDKSFREELKSCMRFNPYEVKKARDGLTYAAMGFPPIIRAIGLLIMNAALKPDAQNQTNLKKIKSSSHLVLLTTKDNSAASWIALGQTLERLLLTASSLGIAHAYLNQPCEVKSLAAEMRANLPIDNAFPGIILRLGYAEPASFSPRRRLETLISQ